MSVLFEVRGGDVVKYKKETDKRKSKMRDQEEINGQSTLAELMYVSI